MAYKKALEEIAELMDIVQFTDELLKRLRDRSRIFVIDNIKKPTEADFTLIHNAMMIGSLVRGDLEMEKELAAK